MTEEERQNKYYIFCPDYRSPRLAEDRSSICKNPDPKEGECKCCENCCGCGG